jgi:hypothetical protein
MKTTDALIADVAKLAHVCFEANEAVYYDTEHQLACKTGGIYKCFLIGLPAGAKVTPIRTKPNVSLLELKELCYARTMAKEFDSSAAIRADHLIRHTRNLRELLRCHRFDVLSWLMLQGVDLPQCVIADEAHPAVGDQSL